MPRRPTPDTGNHLPAYVRRIIDRECNHAADSAVSRIRDELISRFRKRKKGVIVSGQEVRACLDALKVQLTREADATTLLAVQRISAAIDEIISLYREKFACHLHPTKKEDLDS